MNAYISGYARTPFTKFTGQLAAQPATVLGAHAIAAALERSGIAPDDVDAVYMGQVLQAGAGQGPARQAAVGAGIPMSVPAMTLNALCLSGLESITAAVRLIELGEADIVVAGGQESMSLAPHLIHARAGKKYGAMEVLDSIDADGLSDAFEKRSMGATTEAGNTDLGLSRERQDAYAAASHQRAAAAAEFLAGEIAPITLTTRRGETVVSADDGVRADTTPEALAGLRPAFATDGTITAGNASQITDGAAAVVVVSQRAVDARGLEPLARIESHAFVAGPGVGLHSQPSNAIHRALQRLEEAGTPLQVEDLAVVEINEAFAAVALQSVDELGLAEERVNPRGGAISLGHPIGASGARIVGTLARQLAELGEGAVGAAGICGGGGQGSAMILRSV